MDFILVRTRLGTLMTCVRLSELGVADIRRQVDRVIMGLGALNYGHSP